MPKNWKTHKLKEVLEIKNGKSKPKKVGNIPIYGGNGILGYSNKHNNCSKVVIIGRVGAYCGSVFYEDNPIWISDNAMSAKVKETGSNKFYYYLLQHLNLNSFAGGSSQPLLTQSTLNEININVPDLPEQKAIANILSAIDDKIENNFAINKTLEDMAMALYKHWFVDFEFPVTEETHPELVSGSHCLGYKSAGGEFIDSELGLIPKGWEVKKISEVFDVKDGTHDSPKRKEEGNYLITSKHLKRNNIDYSSAYKISKEDFDKVNDRSLVEKGDILMTMIGTVGNFFFVNHQPDYAIKNIGLFKTSKVPNLQSYLYSFFKSKICQDFIEAQMSGSTQQYITLTTLRNFPVIFPKNDIIKEYTKTIKDSFDKIDINIKENQSLTQLRDTLLPKLISGEVRLKEFREKVQEVM